MSLLKKVLFAPFHSAKGLAKDAAFGPFRRGRELRNAFEGKSPRANFDVAGLAQQIALVATPLIAAELTDSFIVVALSFVAMFIAINAWRHRFEIEAAMAKFLLGPGK
jgi:hypothetical protein